MGLFDRMKIGNTSQLNNEYGELIHVRESRRRSHAYERQRGGNKICSSF
jgi:hypothetical protein